MAAETRPGRDALGNLFFYLHLAILVFIVLGWLAPVRGVLLFYLVFLPVVALHWKLNRDTCVLNNIENWVRHRRWRMPQSNVEEGAWLRTLIHNVTGIGLAPWQMNLITYGAMAGFWLLAWTRWRFS